jgi:hypothetical protein
MVIGVPVRQLLYICFPTAAQEKLAIEYGDNGAEMLNKFISGYFERLIAVIIEWGGEYAAKWISASICFILFASDSPLMI